MIAADPSRTARPGPTLLAALLVALPCAAQTIVRTWTGAAAVDQMGRAVLALPDVDADGRPDIAFGSPLRSTAAGFGAGAVEIRSGATGNLIATFTGPTAGERFGSALALADVDGDGAQELAVGSPLFSGPAGSAAGRVTVHALPGGAVLRTLDGLAAGDRFGTALAGLGDADGDLRHDLAVGSPFHDGPAGTSTGLVSLHSGASGALFWSIAGEAIDDRLGTALADAGDLDQSFRRDVLAAAPFHDGPAGADSGRVYLFSESGVLLGFASGAAAIERFGTAVAGPGDLDGDGVREVVVSAEAAASPAGAGAGRVTALRGTALTVLWNVAGPQAGALLGSSVADAGDLDGDGRSEIAVGSRLHDGPAGVDAGRGAVLAGATGATLFTADGPSAGAQMGFASGGGRDFDNDGRADAVFAAPFAAAQAGLARALRVDPPSWRLVRGYTVGLLPEAVAAADADGDGDLDLAVVCSGDATLRILWNGDHATSGPSFGTGILDQIPSTTVALDASAAAVSVAAGNLDADAPGEIVVGRADGSVQRVDGTGTTGAPSFPASAPFAVDARPLAGPVRDLGIYGSGPGAVLVAALAGTLVLPGEVRLVATPMTSPIVGPALLSGGTFTSVSIADLDASGLPDLVLANSSTGSAGGIHVLIAPALVPAPGSPFAAGGAPSRASVSALDGDLATDDIVVAATSFLGGGPRVLNDFSPGAGFRSIVTPAAPLLARDAAAWRRSESVTAAVVADGSGKLLLLDAWTGTGFSAPVPIPCGQDVVDVLVAQLTAFDGPTTCNGQEIVAVVRDERAVRVIRRAQPAVFTPIAGTGCPAAAPVSLFGITGTPVLGDLGFGLALTGAAPNAFAWLAIQVSPQPGLPPFVLPIGACGFAWYGGQIFLIDWFTTPAGTSLFPLPLPVEPGLLCLEFALCWAVFDGGPVPGGITLSNSVLVRLGEIP